MARRMGSVAFVPGEPLDLGDPVWRQALRLAVLADVRHPHGSPLAWAVAWSLAPGLAGLVRPGVYGTAIGGPLLAAMVAGAVASLAVFAVRAWRSTYRPVDGLLATWRSTVGGPDGAFAGTTVHGPVRPHPAGRQFGWELDGDTPRSGSRANAVTVETIQSKVHLLTDVYQVQAGTISVVPRVVQGGFTVRYVDPEWTAQQARAEADRRARVIEWTAPTLDPVTGAFAPAEVVDTGEPAVLDLWTPGWGARHMWLMGDTGSGKTYFLDNVLLDACSSGLWVPHIIDLEDGPTLDKWRLFAASFAADLGQANEVWDALHAEHDARKPRIKDLPDGGDVMVPTREDPGHLLVVDGGPRAVQDRTFMDHLRRAAYEWRKFVMKVVWVSQMGTADQAFGKAELGGTQLRSQFKDRVGFRANPEASDAMFGDHKLLPSIGEDTPGVAYLRSNRYPTPTLIKGKVQHDRAGLRGKWLDIPAWSRPAGAPAAPAWGPQPLEPVRSTGAQVYEMPARSTEDALLRALRSMGGQGHWRDVVAASGVSKSTAYPVFGRLCQEGRASSPERGVWKIEEGR